MLNSTVSSVQHQIMHFRIAHIQEHVLPVNIPNIGISQTFFFLATDLNPESSPDNLFDVLSLCNEVNHSWRAMRAHTVALRRPLFAVLAACYEVVMKCSIQPYHYITAFVLSRSDDDV